MIVQTREQFDEVLARLKQTDRVTFDCETTGLDLWKDARQCGIGFTFPGEEDGYYLPFRHPDNNLPLAWLEELFQVLQYVETLTGYNIKFDVTALYQDGYRPPRAQRFEDLIVAARLCEPDRYGSLELRNQLTKLFGQAAASYDFKFKEYLKQNKWSKTFHLAPADVVGEYCVLDTVWTERARDRYLERIAETNQTEVWENEEVPLAHLFWRLEQIGVAFDKDYVDYKLPQLRKRAQDILDEIYTIVGEKFNLNSPKQLHAAMRKIGVKSPLQSEKTKLDSWNAEALALVDHPVTDKIKELRGVEKLASNYFEPATTWIDFAHPKYRSQGAITGRISVSDPAVQTIAKNTQDLASAVVNEEILKASRGKVSITSTEYEDTADNVSARRIFVARPGFKLLFADYSQMEMRVFADYCRDPVMAELLEDPNFDFHDHVATEVWGVTPESELWKFYRSLAKAINFGLIFGIGVKKLAKQIQRPVKEAQQYREDYFAQFPKAQVFIDMVRQTVSQRGYIRNRFNRRYYLPSDRDYVGVNYLVQGTSADIVKNRMLALDDWFTAEGLRSRIIIQVHDEVIFEVPEDELEIVPFNVKRIMEERLIDTFLPAEVSYSDRSWAEKEDMIVVPGTERMVVKSQLKELQEVA